MTQAVTGRPFTAKALVRAWVSPCRICDGQSGTGTGFFGFPCQYHSTHNDELHNLYSSPDIIRQVKANEVGGACGTHGRGDKSVQVFGGKARRKETTGKNKA
jgi:hypothetical protein